MYFVIINMKLNFIFVSFLCVRIVGGEILYEFVFCEILSGYKLYKRL